MLTLRGGVRRRVLSWNVAGLRGCLRNEEKRGYMRSLMEAESPDVLCLMETKLQESHVGEVEPDLFEALGLERAEWHAHWACSTAKKGYR